jgi:RNA polymerase sigma-70 factor, ECF subfamily
MADFRELVENESQGLVAAVTAIVGDSGRAHEIVQVAFERCFSRWHRIGRYDRPGAWVRRVAINEAISVTRRAATEARAVQRLGHQDEVARGVHDPLADIDAHGVWDAVRALPEDQAAVIALRYGADLGVDEIAETLQRSPAAVKSLLLLGRAALRSSPIVEAYR